MGILEDDQWYEGWKKTLFGNIENSEKQARGFHILPAEDE